MVGFYFSCEKSMLLETLSSWVYMVFFEHMNGLGFLFEWPVWSPSSNNNFHISNTLTDISTHFFTHTNFKKFQKISNNNSQTHLPNMPYFFFVGLQMKFLVKRASVYELQCREGILNVLGCDFQALFSILKDRKSVV